MLTNNSRQSLGTGRKGGPRSKLEWVSRREVMDAGSQAFKMVCICTECYDFKQFRQSSTVVGSKVRGQKNASLRVLDLYCLTRFESEVQVEE